MTTQTSTQTGLPVEKWTQGIMDALQRRKWNFEISENSVLIGFQGDHADFRAIVRLLKEQKALQILVFYPFQIPREMRKTVCEGIARMNYGLYFTSCEIDMEDGELRCRGIMPIDQDLFYSAQFESLLISVISTADKYYPAFHAILDGSHTPREAIEIVEKKKESETDPTSK